MAAGLPAAAAVELAGDPLAVAIVRAGCRGYWLITRTAEAIQAAAMREAINAALGVTIPQREAMAAGSMFGYGCPAADPANYDDAGNMRPAPDAIAPEKPGPAEDDCRGW
jgi:hypothetical protein